MFVVSFDMLPVVDAVAAKIIISPILEILFHSISLMELS
jgi:hypothetical protein